MLLPKADWHDHPRFSGLVKEKEGEGGHEKQERKRETALDVWGERGGGAHQEEFWFW